MIYCQRYLREQGLAVTYAGTQYEIRAQIWNNSTDAPAVGLDVDFVYHDYGIGPAAITIGSDTVTLPIKGAPGHPATARAMWITPNTPGHYCIRVQLNWADDANPKNNLGQENTSVGDASSPAVFRFPVRNESTIRRALRLVADAYAIPEPIECKERPKKKTTDREHPELVLSKGFIPPLERDADWTLARIRHGPDAHPVPPGWSVELQPEVLDLNAGETRNVEVSVTPPEGYVGQKAINVNALHGTDLVGGVTLLVNAG
jgi:hypothetical protein